MRQRNGNVNIHPAAKRESGRQRKRKTPAESALCLPRPTAGGEDDWPAQSDGTDYAIPSPHLVSLWKPAARHAAARREHAAGRGSRDRSRLPSASITTAWWFFLPMSFRPRTETRPPPSLAVSPSRSDPADDLADAVMQWRSSRDFLIASSVSREPVWITAGGPAVPCGRPAGHGRSSAGTLERSSTVRCSRGVGRPAGSSCRSRAAPPPGSA